jgi:hypothetical protein
MRMGTTAWAHHREIKKLWHLTINKSLIAGVLYFWSANGLKHQYYIDANEHVKIW